MEQRPIGTRREQSRNAQTYYAYCVPRLGEPGRAILRHSLEEEDEDGFLEVLDSLVELLELRVEVGRHDEKLFLELELLLEESRELDELDPLEDPR